MQQLCSFVDLFSMLEDTHQVLLQHGVWRGGADLVLVLLKLIASMIEAFVVSELNFKFLKLFWSILQMMF